MTQPLGLVKPRDGGKKAGKIGRGERNGKGEWEGGRERSCDCVNEYALHAHHTVLYCICLPQVWL